MASPNKPWLALFQSVASVSTRTPAGICFLTGLGGKGTLAKALKAILLLMPAILEPGDTECDQGFGDIGVGNSVDFIGFAARDDTIRDTGNSRSSGTRILPEYSEWSLGYSCCLREGLVHQ